MARRDHQKLRSTWTRELQRLAAKRDLKGHAEMLDYIKAHVDRIGVFERQWVGIVNGASLRGIAVTLAPHDALDLFRAQRGRCAVSGMPIDFAPPPGAARRGWKATASLDRIRSDGAYEIGNVWWVHRDINRMKSDLSPERFLSLCRLIVARADEADPVVRNDRASLAADAAGLMRAAPTTLGLAPLTSPPTLVAEFLRVSVEDDQHHAELSSALWARFLAWCDGIAAEPCSQTAFGRALRSFGYHSARGHVVTWHGLRLLPCEGARVASTLEKPARSSKPPMH